MKGFSHSLLLGLCTTFSMPGVAWAAADFKSALKLYEDKDYEASYEAFKELANSDYTQVEYNYYMARSAFFVKKYNEAISAYERILIEYPNNGRSKLELGRIYYVLHRYTQARKYLNDVLRSDAPVVVKNNIRYYLALMEENERLAAKSPQQKPKKNTVLVTLLGSLFYDTNLNYSPENDALTLPSGTLSSASDIGAWGTEQMLIVNHRYENPAKYDFAIKNDLTLYNKLAPGNSDFNILYGSYAPAMSFQRGRWVLDAGISLDAMNYGKNPYLVSYGLAPKAVYIPNFTEYYSAQLKLLKRDYQTSATRPKNSKFAQLVLKYQKRMGPLLSWYGQGTVETETPDSTPSTVVNVDYQMLGLKTGATYLLPQRMSIAGSLGYQSKHFKDDDRLLKFFGASPEKQQDKRYYAEVVVTKEFDKTLSAQFRASRVQNTSNISVYAYQKSLFTLNVIKRF